MKGFSKSSKSGSFPLAAMIDEDVEQNLPYTEVGLDGAAVEGATSTSTTENDSSSTNNSDSPGMIAKPKPMIQRRLTEVSRKYDRDGKGYLNETETALRRMDSKNKGFIDDDKVGLVWHGFTAGNCFSSAPLLDF